MPSEAGEIGGKVARSIPIGQLRGHDMVLVFVGSINENGHVRLADMKQLLAC